MLALLAVFIASFLGGGIFSLVVSEPGAGPEVSFPGIFLLIFVGMFIPLCIVCRVIFKSVQLWEAMIKTKVRTKRETSPYTSDNHDSL